MEVDWRPVWKVEVEDQDRWIERDARRLFSREGNSRLQFTLPKSMPGLVHEVCSCLQPPFQILYVLHTSRGEGPLGRYQSPELGRSDLENFFTRFGDFLVGDGRHDLWVRSVHSGNVVVWDRHNDVYVYGASPIAERLEALGFEEGELDPIGTHRHCYRAEFDADARDLLAALQWARTGLRPEDEQYVAPVVNDP